MANETVLFKRGDSATITSTPVTDGQILFDTSGNGKMYLDNGTDRLEMGGAITVDASLSKTSTNAIQNKAVTGNILNSLAEVSAATQQNTIAGALALKEVNSSLSVVESKFGNLDKMLVIEGTLSGATGYTEVTVLDESIRGKATIISVVCSDGEEIATNGTVVVKIHPQTGLVRIYNSVPQFVGYPYVLLLAVTK